jgi:arginyl-tRNA synthetase
MHIGHLRSTVIGDALVRVLEFLGHDVVRENHIGDWGRPFGMLIEHLVDVGVERAERLGLGDLDAFYKEATAKFADDEAFRERARRRVVLLQSRDEATLDLWRSLVAQSAAHWNDVYVKLGVLLTDDDLAGESRYQSLMPEVVDRLREAGLLKESDGAEVVFPPGFSNREGEPLPLIVRSRAGAFTYATSDLACVLDRVERVGATRLLYVVGADQVQHLAMVFAVAEMAGWLVPPARAEHAPFGLVLGTDRRRLRSRSGEAVKLVDVVDEAIERGQAAVAEKNPELPAEQRAAVGHAVGIGALKYADLAPDRIRDYVFDWDRMLSFDGNTAPYLQYAHARICSIFRRAGIARADARDTTPALAEPQERALAMRVLGFGAVVHETAERASPHRLCTYLYELASDFTDFYEHCPVLRAPDAGTRASRLALSDVTARVLAQGLQLLGIDAPDQM